MITRKIIALFSAFLLMVSNLSILSGAESYITSDDSTIAENEEIQPLYDIIHIISIEAFEDGVEAIMETDSSASLQITITIYQEKGSSWSMLSKKSFSRIGTVLSVKSDYDFQPGITYKTVVNFRAGGETDSMEDIFSF